MEWKQVKPSWCPHLIDCVFLRRVQDSLCAGQLLKPISHDGDVNTHRICFNGVLPNNEVFDLQTNKSDVFHLKRILNVIDEKNEVVITQENSEGFSEEWYEYFKCPNCGDEGVAYIFKFCPECGCKIKWKLRESK